MHRSSHLRLRNGIFYYHRRVPLSLVKRLKKTIVSFSLATSDPKVARKKRDLEDLKQDALFEAALAAPPEAAGSRTMSVQAIVRTVQEYVEHSDQFARAREIGRTGFTHEERAEVKLDLEMGRELLARDEDPNGHQWAYSEGTKALGYPPSALDPENGLLPFLEVMRRGLLELQDRKLFRLEGDFSRPFVDPMFAPAARAGVTFGEAAEDHLSEVRERAEANRTSQKWVDEQEAHTALLNEIIGADTPLIRVDYDRCRSVRAVLGTIPANRQKLYPKLDLETAIQLAEKQQKPTMSPITQEGYLFTFRSIMSLAAKKRRIPVNPAEGLTPLKRETVRAKDRRLPWTAEQLEGFFCGEFYRSCQRVCSTEPYRADVEGWRFWLPLLSLFMGMRANEICQLKPGDVQVTSAGTWFIDVTNSGEGEEADEKRLKTQTSRRKVPIHPEILAMGFLGYAQLRQDQRAERMFPTLRADRYGYFSKYPMRRFRESFIPEEIALGRRRSFHSLRHNFRDALRRAEVSADALQALGGWSQGKRVSDNYGDLENPDLQFRNLARVNYPQLDLRFLNVSHCEA